MLMNYLTNVDESLRKSQFNSGPGKPGDSHVPERVESWKSSLICEVLSYKWPQWVGEVPPPLSPPPFSPSPLTSFEFPFWPLAQCPCPCELERGSTTQWNPLSPLLIDSTSFSVINYWSFQLPCNQVNSSTLTFSPAPSIPFTPYLSVGLTLRLPCLTVLTAPENFRHQTGPATNRSEHTARQQIIPCVSFFSSNSKRAERRAEVIRNITGKGKAGESSLSLFY